MGAGASTKELSREGTISTECQQFIDMFMPYTVKNDSSKKMRNEAWKAIDNNGNGHVSLAETGKWILEALKIKFLDEGKLERGTGKTSQSSLKDVCQKAKDKGKALYKIFYPCYIRAFLDAADIGKNKSVRGTKSATTDDYVQRSEFRFLNVYLCIYALMYDAFAQVDGGIKGKIKDDDRRITKSELGVACPKFKGHPLVGLKQLGMPGSYGNLDAIFKEMDADGKGMVLLNEWCLWLEKKESEHKTELGVLLTWKEGEV